MRHFLYLTNGSDSCQHFSPVFQARGCQGTEHISVSVNMIPHIVLSGKMFTALIWRRFFFFPLNPSVLSPAVLTQFDLPGALQAGLGSRNTQWAFFFSWQKRGVTCSALKELGLEVGDASPHLQSCQVQVPGSSQVLFLLELCIPPSPWLGAPTPSRVGGIAAASWLCWQPGMVEGAGMCHGTVTCPTVGPCSPPLCQGDFAV